MTITSWSTPAIALAAVLASLFAGAVAVTGEIELGVATDGQGGIVREVSPDSFGWEAGFRVGQQVLRLRFGDEEGGWALQTAEASGGSLVALGPATTALRASGVLALLALVLGVLALPASRLQPRRAELLAAAALLFAAVPVLLAYERSAGLVILGLAAVGPWVWAYRWRVGPRTWGAGAVVAGAGLWLAWILCRLGDPVAAVGLRVGLQIWIVGAAALLVLAGSRVTRAQLFSALATTRLIDAAVLAGSAVIAIGLIGLGIHPALAALVVVLPLVLLARTRKRVAVLLDRVLLAELREREAIRATEEERARVSREIHDDPLQEIVGVIRTLEGGDPANAAARESLRHVAARLRGVATELHPPVLDDLGLAPALEASARQVPEPPVGFAVSNRAGYGRPDRPPSDVELAVYRIVQEALANAVRHARANGITLTGDVAAARIDISVVDDGVGLDDDRIDAALRDGRMGVASMRRRAEAIGARLETTWIGALTRRLS
ncbi:MAG: ATP-binding protein [Candidatus Limnocylindrales bacterium]